LEKLVIDENVINQRKNKNDATTATTNENGNEGFLFFFYLNFQN